MPFSRSSRLASPGLASTLTLLLLLLASTSNIPTVVAAEADAPVANDAAGAEVSAAATQPLAVEGGSSAGAAGVLGGSWIGALIDNSDNDNGDSDSDDDGDAAAGAEDPLYEPDFGIFDRGILGRAPAGVTALANNVPEQLNVEPNSTQVFMFEKTIVASREEEEEDGSVVGAELRRRSGEGEEGEEEEDLEDDSDLPVVRRARKARTIYLSANTCIQPQPVSDTVSAQAPQLTMYLSTTFDSTTPGPNSNSTSQTVHVFTEGAVMVTLNTTKDVYIGIHAPNISPASTSSSSSTTSSSSTSTTTTAALSGTYNFQVAASVDAPYHSYDNQTDADLIWVDSDASAALLITHNLTDASSNESAIESAMATAPYVMFAQNTQQRRAIDGVRFSYCGLQNYAQIAATNNGKFASLVTTSMTRIGLGNLPKQQFYFSGLNASSSYDGILAALPQNNTGTGTNTGTVAIGSNVAGGGGKVSRATRFTTQGANVNCEIVYNLTFCNETAYAVPSNPARFADATALARVYDDYAAGIYANFQRALAQIPCEAPDAQRYSLARGCSDCAAAYKNWLCSVAMPRCADFDDNSTYLQPRAVGQPFPDGSLLDADVMALYPNTSAYNASRNAFIDETIAPGPYKEVLPCDDLCYSLVQSCPSDLGFSCPLPGHVGFNTSYGQRAKADQNGAVTCNFPGSAHYFSAGPAAPRWSVAGVVAVVGSMLMWV